jgi:acyl-homoserine lactone acylase PvdQ
VTIRRNEWGVPHIDGPTDASVAFGMAYVPGRIPCVEPYSNPVC